jgi:hypothetical protein
MAMQLTFSWEGTTPAETTAWWAGELTRSGFRDIELPCGLLSGDPAADRRQDELDAGREYYRLAADYLRATRFPWRLERVIWAAHAEGQTMREVLATARAARLASVRLAHVHAVIDRHRAVMLGRLGGCKR